MTERGRREDHIAAGLETIGGSLLGGLGPTALRELLELAEFERLSPGDVLMCQGEVGDSAYLVLVGELDVIVETPLGEVTMATVGPQEIVGEVAIFTRLPRTATIRARQSSTLMRLTGADLVTVIAAHPETALGLLAALGRRLAALNQPLAMLTRAAQALERAELDADTLAGLVGPPGDGDPFAQSARKLVREMEKKQARQQEMAVAARLQQSILPRRLDFASRGACFAVDAFMRPARDIGGDFYDYFFTEDGTRAVVLVADVSGKGVPAALFMAVTRTIIKASALDAPSIEVALQRANAQLEDENPEGLFVTVFVAELDLATGRLTYINAGHCDGYVVRSAGAVSVLPANAPAVALLPGPSFRGATVTLQPGDKLMLVSDGVTEACAPSGQMFGDERLKDLLSSLSRQSEDESLAAVEDAVTRFADGCEQSDDITCLALIRL